jgi:hypothetical protein
MKYPIGPGGPPMPLDAMGAEYGAIADFAELGSAIASAEGRRIYQADADAQTIEGIAEMKRRLNTQFDTYDTDADERNYRPGYDKTIKGFDNIIKGKTNGIAKRNLRDFIVYNSPTWENNVNDAILRRKRINTEARAEQNIERIKELDLTNIDGVLEAEAIMGESVKLLGEIGYGSEEIQLWTENALKDFEAQTINQQAEAIMGEQGREAAIEHIMSQDIEIDTKKKIVSNINFKAAQQKLKYDQKVEQIEQEYVAKYDKEQLSSSEVVANPYLPASRKLFWKRLVDAQVKERLEGEPELNWETYDRLQGMVESYDRGIIGKDEVRNELSEAVENKEIPTTVARQLRDRLATKDKADDPMNRSDVKRGMSIIDYLEKEELRIAKDAAEDTEQEWSEITRIRNENFKRKNEFEQWIRGQEKFTAKDVEDKIQSMSRQKVDEVVLGWFEKLVTPKKQEKEIIARKKVEKLKELGYWDAFSANEQETVRQAFREGKTVEDIVELLE